MATLRDISKRIGVSSTTISRVLNHDETIAVSAETRRAIFETAYSLGYQTPRKRKLLKNMTVIGVADWHVQSGNAPSACVRSLKYYADMEMPTRTLDFVRIGQHEKRAVDGVIAFGQLSDRELEELQQCSPYILLVNTSWQGSDFDRLYVDLDSSWDSAFDYLVTDCGCHRIGYIGGQFEGPDYTIGDKRKAKLVTLMQKRGLYYPSLIRVGKFSEESGYEMANSLLDAGESADALIIGNDCIAVGVVRALQERGLEIPRDLRIVIYQDVQMAQLPVIDCAVVMAYPNILWQKAIQMLVDRIDGSTETITTVIFPQLNIVSPR